MAWEEPPVSLLLISGVSRSKLLDAELADGVLEPVRVGDCMGDSLMGDEVIVSVAFAWARSLPVMASEIARRPVLRDFLLKKEYKWVWAAGEGEARPWDEVSLPAT